MQLASGEKGPMFPHVFNYSLNEPVEHVPEEHVARGMADLRKLQQRLLFWRVGTEAKEAIDTVVRRLRARKAQL
jgi:hypothetical protein